MAPSGVGSPRAAVRVGSRSVDWTRPSCRVEPLRSRPVNRRLRERGPGRRGAAAGPGHRRPRGRRRRRWRSTGARRERRRSVRRPRAAAPGVGGGAADGAGVDDQDARAGGQRLRHLLGQLGGVCGGIDRPVGSRGEPRPGGGHRSGVVGEGDAGAGADGGRRHGRRGEGGTEQAGVGVVGGGRGDLLVDVPPGDGRRRTRRGRGGEGRRPARPRCVRRPRPRGYGQPAVDRAGARADAADGHLRDGAVLEEGPHLRACCPARSGTTGPRPCR